MNEAPQKAQRLIVPDAVWVGHVALELTTRHEGSLAGKSADIMHPLISACFHTL